MASDCKPVVGRCSIVNCSSSETDAVAYFTIRPEDNFTYSLWAKCTSMPDSITATLKELKICENHFEKFYVENVGSDKRIWKNAIPTLGISHVINDFKLEEMFKNDTLSFGQILGHIQKKIFNITNNFEEKSIVEDFFDKLSLHIYIVMPNMYRILKYSLKLSPYEKFQQIILSSFNKTEEFYKLLKSKFSYMSDDQKKCILCVLEVQVKPDIYYNITKDTIFGLYDNGKYIKNEVATKATIIYVQGIIEKWQQPITVVYTHDDNSNLQWIYDIVDVLKKCHLNIQGVLFKAGSVYNSSPCSVKIGAQFVYNIVDPKSWIINFFKSLMKNDCYIRNKRLNVKKLLFDYIKTRDARKLHLTPELTKENFRTISLENFNHIFSSKTAAEMSLCVKNKIILSKSANPMIELQNLIINLINIVCPSLADNKIQFEIRYPTKEAKLQLINDIVQDLNDLTIYDIRNPVNKKKFDYIKNEMLLSLQYIRYINTADNENKYIQTDLINLDYAEIFMKSLRNKNFNRKPNVKDIDEAFKRSCIINYLKPTSKSKNVNENEIKNNLPIVSNICTEVLHEKILLQTNTTNENCDTISYINDIRKIKIPSSEYTNLKINTVSELTDYLLEKCVEYHNDCKIVQENQKKIRYNLQCFVAVLEKEFNVYLENVDLFKTGRGKFMEIILVRLQNTDFEACECFPNLYLKKLYLRFKIYHTLRMNRLDIKSRLTNKITNRLQN